MALIDQLLEQAKGILQEPISKAKRITRLQRSGILGRLASIHEAASDLGSIVRRLGLGIGGEFSGAQRSRVLREIRRSREISERLRTPAAPPIRLGDAQVNPDLFAEGLFGRRFRIGARWTIVDPDTGMTMRSGGNLDFAVPPTLAEIRESAFSLSELRINVSPDRHDEIGSPDFFLTDIHIVSIERAF